MNKTYLPDPLNKQTSVLVDAQTDIKIAIKGGVLSGAPSYAIKAKIREIIESVLKRINSTVLRENARISLMQFAEKAYMTLRNVLPNPTMSLAVYLLTKSINKKRAAGKLTQEEFYAPSSYAERQAMKTLSNGGYFHTTAKGIPLREFQKTYIDRVSKALSDIASQNALDSDDLTGRNSLRNFAEMQVRYERHLEEIQKLKNDGVKLVVCSVHADCSDRCKEWQGRVYSLDGTYGTTEDGRQYIPLEVATDVYYTTKKGKRYKNGLLGFNCRHKLLPYKVGMLIPTISEEERKREDLITKRQRELERTVIRWREEALMQKGVNAVGYKNARKNAINANKRYQEYSKTNGRAYYPDRVKIL